MSMRLARSKGDLPEGDANRLTPVIGTHMTCQCRLRTHSLKIRLFEAASFLGCWVILRAFIPFSRSGQRHLSEWFWLSIDVTRRS